MAIRKKQEPDEYQKALRKFHKKSNRHVVVFEADISEDEKRRIFSDADHLRQCGNELLGIMERNLEQLLRTKRQKSKSTISWSTESIINFPFNFILTSIYMNSFLLNARALMSSH